MAVREYYDDYRPGCLSQFDLILACGDLKRPYLEFLVTMARCPLLYVRGNHDDDFALEPPEGCICIEDRIYVHQGIRILGLGGSYRYRKGNNMFTEAQMGLQDPPAEAQALAQRRNRHSGNSRSRPAHQRF